MVLIINEDNENEKIEFVQISTVINLSNITLKLSFKIKL